MKSGVIKIISGSVLFITGAFIIPIIVAIAIPNLLGNTNGKQFLVPGKMQVVIENPGRYYLWNNYQTVYDGRTFNLPEALPGGLEIKIEDIATGEKLPFESDSSATIRMGNETSRAIGYVTLSNPCTVSITVSGSTEPHVFSFARSIISGELMTFLGILGVGFIAACIGFGLVVWGSVNLIRAKKKSTSTAIGDDDQPAA